MGGEKRGAGRDNRERAREGERGQKGGRELDRTRGEVVWTNEERLVGDGSEGERSSRMLLVVEAGVGRERARIDREGRSWSVGR